MENLSRNDEFEQVASSLPGITVFAPKPKLEEERKAQTYTCPQRVGNLGLIEIPVLYFALLASPPLLRAYTWNNRENNSIKDFN